MGNKDKNILDYWRILVKRKWVIFTSLAVIGVTVVLGSLLRDPIYVATIRIQIEQNAPNILPFQDMISGVSVSRRDYYETQFTLIQGRQVARDVLIYLRLGDHPEFRVEIPRRLTTGLSPDDYSEAKRIDRFLKNLTVSPVRNSRLVDIRYHSRDPILAFRAAHRRA